MFLKWTLVCTYIIGSVKITEKYYYPLIKRVIAKTQEDGGRNRDTVQEVLP